MEDHKLMVEKINRIAPTSPLIAVGENKTASERNNMFQTLLLDKLGLSNDAQNKVLWAKAQFEANYQVLRSINSSQNLATSQEFFAFKASYEFLQNASGGESLKISDENNEGDTLTQLQDYFSPENTSQRILDVALSFFGASETFHKDGNNEASRKKFADFIGGAINTGFNQAREILGNLPGNITTGLEKTHSIVLAGLDDFVENGINPEKNRPGGVYEKIAAYRREASSKFNSLNNSSSSSSYNSSGEENFPASSPTISKVG